MTGLRIERAGPEAIPAIMRFERQPGYEMLVGRFSEAEHRATMADPANAYLVGHDDDIARAFALLCALDDPHGNVLLRRIAVETAGQGFGRRFMDAVIDWTFTTIGSTHRLWLDVLEHNTRARHVYRRAGLREDGTLRESYLLPDGRRVSRIMMALLRPEWEARRAELGQPDSC